MFLATDGGGVCGVWVVEVRVGCACWWFGVTDGGGGVGFGGVWWVLGVLTGVGK